MRMKVAKIGTFNNGVISGFELVYDDRLPCPYSSDPDPRVTAWSALELVGLIHVKQQLGEDEAMKLAEAYRDSAFHVYDVDKPSVVA